MILILFLLQGFSSEETDFYFCQFLSNFFRYSSSNLLSFHSYNIFAIYFLGNFSLLKSLSSAISNFYIHSPFKLSYHFLCIFKFSSLFPESCSIVNSFHCTRYFMTLLIFILFSIFSTFHSLTSSISTSFISSTFCSPTYSLYHTIQLIFTTRWILIEIGSHNLTALVDIILLMKYRLMYQSTSFFASHSLNTKSFILNITLSPFFYSSTSFLLLFACYFIFSCAFLNVASASFYTFFILSANSITFFTFYFLLILATIFNSLL